MELHGLWPVSLTYTDLPVDSKTSYSTATVLVICGHLSAVMIIKLSSYTMGVIEVFHCQGQFTSALPNLMHVDLGSILQYQDHIMDYLPIILFKIVD